jgi:CDGSH iron-sulfur domain-containing protein 3
MEMEPLICATRSKVMAMEPGTYSWCSCGYSTNQPFCDGKHIGKGFCPQTLTLEAPTTVAFCMCKHSAKGALCDGSHRNLPVQPDPNEPTE